MGAWWGHEALVSEQGEIRGIVCHIIQHYGEIRSLFRAIFPENGCSRCINNRGFNQSGLWYVCLQEECQNYIRVLLISGRTLFTCGTNAFTPVCITRQVGMQFIWRCEQLVQVRGTGVIWTSKKVHNYSKFVLYCHESDANQWLTEGRKARSAIFSKNVG